MIDDDQGHLRDDSTSFTDTEPDDELTEEQLEAAIAADEAQAQAQGDGAVAGDAFASLGDPGPVWDDVVGQAGCRASSGRGSAVWSTPTSSSARPVPPNSKRHEPSPRRSSRAVNRATIATPA